MKKEIKQISITTDEGGFTREIYGLGNDNKIYQYDHDTGCFRGHFPGGFEHTIGEPLKKEAD